MNSVRNISACQMKSLVRFSHSRVRERRTRELIDKILRVDHAGENGAVRIYAGQLAVLKRSSSAPCIQEMKKGEEEHLRQIEGLMPSNRSRPSLLLPLFNTAAYALGVTSAMLGSEAAMACTVAVETVIGEHYDNQIRSLIEDGGNDPSKHQDLIQLLSKLRDEELEHLDTGIENNAEQAPLYQFFSSSIKVGCKAAIWVAEKI